MLNSNVTSLKKSVSDGKTLVANAITGQGVSTAANAAFSTMATNIGTVGTNKYNSGYSSGRSQGQNDVKNSPNSYGLYTKSQYDSNYNNGYNTGRSQGQSDVKSKGSKSAIWLVPGNSGSSLRCYDANYFSASGNTIYCTESRNYFIANAGYNISGNININGSTSWYGDCNVYHNGTTRYLNAGSYIIPNISAGSAGGSEGMVIVQAV